MVYKYMRRINNTGTDCHCGTVENLADVAQLVKLYLFALLFIEQEVQQTEVLLWKQMSKGMSRLICG